jgi:hypothetical protein
VTDDEHRAARDPEGTDGPDAVLPDPRDPVVAAALARTRDDLAAHGARTPAPPADLLAGIDRALAAERAGPDPGPGPARRRRPALVAGALVAAAAAVVALVVLVAVLPATSGPAPAPRAPTAAPAPPVPVPDVPVLAGGDGPAALRAGLGSTDYGPLAAPGRLAGCLAAHGVPPGVRPVGARQVVVDGRPGVLLVLPTGTAARFRLLAVGPDCAAGAPFTLSDTLVGR